jgi:organic hydroperoxide reductase OsmC/OhrA
MNVAAQVQNSQGDHRVTLITDGQSHSLQIPSKPSGLGSSANGGELLFLALATCYCNDIYREAGKQGIHIVSVEVEVEGTFGAAGEPAQSIKYRARVTGQAGKEAIEALMWHTDSVAEIQNTLRLGLPVTLFQIEAVSA